MGGPGFDLAVEPGGYAWWYVDVLDPDSGHGLTLILFVGSVFSPGYHRARQADRRADPVAHCGVNVALYRPGGDAWVMTEVAGVERSADALSVSGTTARWVGGALEIAFDERRAPFGQRMRGRVRLHPAATFDAGRTLDPRGAHRWWPVAPVAHAVVELDTPRVRFSGHAYHDVNWGDEGLEDGFRRWDWSRASARDATRILYDVDRADGSHERWGRVFHADGRVTESDPPIRERLRPGTWRVEQAVRTERPGSVRVVRPLEDTPFYTRNWLETLYEGRPAPTMHESLDMRRFEADWVRFLLPFRMRGGWRTGR
ncbi:MAG: carotenoid 1,2-hydratase [Myxococcales bacterium]|nr:carotenoid 1,2-hydratase [Myxococcales bacterium]